MPQSLAFIKLFNKYLFSVLCKCVAYNSINDLVPDFKGQIIKLSKNQEFLPTNRRCAKKFTKTCLIPYQSPSKENDIVPHFTNEETGLGQFHSGLGSLK